MKLPPGVPWQQIAVALGPDEQHTIEMLPWYQGMRCLVGFRVINRSLDAPRSATREERVGQMFSLLRWGYGRLSDKTRERLSFPLYFKWYESVSGLPALTPSGARKWLCEAREAGYIEAVAKRRWRKFRYKYNNPERAAYYEDLTQFEGDLAVRLLKNAGAGSKPQPMPDDALRQLNKIPWLDDASRKDGIARQMAPWPPLPDHPVADKRAQPPGFLAELRELRELRDALAEHPLLQEFADAVLDRGRPKVVGRMVYELPLLKDLLDKHRNERALQAALVYEYGPWTRAKLAENYGVTARQIGLRRSRAVEHLAAAGLG